MQIALDYDETYTADPIFWEAFMKLASEHGHNVYIVTLRNGVVDHSQQLSNLAEFTPIFFTDGNPKEQYLLERGMHIDIWIDDKPESIANGSAMSPGELAEWRKNNID